MSEQLHPYRTASRIAPAPRPERLDALLGALRATRYFVLGWALLRVVVCAVRGFDLGGFVALVVLVAGVATLTRSLA